VGDLGVTYTVHLWLVGKRVVDFLLVLIELLRVPGLLRGVVCVILCLAILIQYRRVTHTQTDRHIQTRDGGYYPRIASATQTKISRCELPFG